MGKSFIQPGKVLTLTAPYNRLSGEGALVGAIFGVAVNDVQSGANGEFETEGVHALKKAGSQAWTVGAKIFWDNSAKQCTTTAANNTFIGVAVEAVGSTADETVGKVKLAGPESNASLQQAANVEEIGGTLTGSTDGDLADVQAIALNTTDTYSDAAVNAAVNAAIADINTNFKELQEKYKEILDALKDAGLMVPDSE